MKNDPEKFVYWLQGFFELANPRVLDDIQVKIIKDHLALVFDKAIPEYDLNTKHSGLCGVSDTKTVCLSGPVQCGNDWTDLLGKLEKSANFKYC